MSLIGTACIVGAYEHPTRKADNLSVVRLHADVAKGALEDAGLSKSDIDGYFCAGDAPGLGTATMAEYLGLKLDDPSFAAPIYANLFDDEDGEGHSLIWSRSNSRRGD